MMWKGSYEARFNLPNFSHGTAGIAYFLAALYEATQEKQFLDGARAGAQWLQAVGDRTDGGFRLFYGWPDPGWARRYDIGWAHGPAGTARLFYKLWQITGEESWRDLVKAAAHSLRTSGLPSQPKAEYGKVFDFSQRFGMAGTARFFLDLYGAWQDPADLEFARRLIDEIRSEPRWKTERYGFMQRHGEKAEFTGYFYGAAGYGLLLLGLDAAENNRPWKLRLPDDPF
jgi:lantibiotic modifying enzyme